MEALSLFLFLLWHGQPQRLPPWTALQIIPAPVQVCLADFEGEAKS
jgi:hypothetical protein